MNTCPRWLSLAVALALAPSAFAQSNLNSSTDGIRSVHQRFEYPFGAWTQGGDDTRYVYLHMSEFWLHTSITAESAARDLPADLRNEVADFAATSDAGGPTLDEYVGDSSVDGLLVVHNGRIVYERYPRMHPSDRHV